MNSNDRYGICRLSVIPVRNTPSEKAEMVSQILFGETYTILDSKTNWLLVRLCYDEYEGWIDQKMHNDLSAADYSQLDYNNSFVTTSVISEVRQENQRIMLLTFGSTLWNILEDKIILEHGASDFIGTYAQNDLPKPDRIGQYAMQFLQVPYLWGGRTVFGIDCSGLNQMVFKAAGIKLFRDAGQQATQGKTIDFIEEAKTGDLAFFDNAEAEIVHAGIIIEPGKIIHASGHVRIDNIDHQGIFNLEEQTYTHRLRLIKRII